jgi:hypothetical protein
VSLGHCRELIIAVIFVEDLRQDYLCQVLGRNVLGKGRDTWQIVVFQHWLDEYTISSVAWSDNSKTTIDIPIYY